MKYNIPISVPVLRGNEWKYVKECLDTGWVSSVGRYVTDFESAMAKYTGCTHAIATSTGTAALHVSLLAGGILPGDEVLVPSLTFVATANAISYCGASPVFMDCFPDTLCIDTEKTISFLRGTTAKDNNNITVNKVSGRPVRAILPVHIFGHPADMEGLRKITDEFNLIMIEDATESIGSEYRGQKTGSFGNAGCFSFNGNKLITCGGGGMIVTDDPALAQKARHLSTQARSDAYEYAHDAIGYNYRLTNIQAALGVAQMEQLDDFINIKRHNAQIYIDLLSGVKEADILGEHPPVRSNFWYIALRVPFKDKGPLSRFLLAQGIQVRPLWKPLHTLPMYKSCQVHDIVNADNAYNSIINLPVSVDLTRKDIASICAAIKEYFSKV